jgi:hypothetical protein
MSLRPLLVVCFVKCLYGSGDAGAALFSASRSGDVRRLATLLDAGNRDVINTVREGSTPLIALLGGWGAYFSTRWPAPLPAGANFSESLNLLLSRGASLSLLCPTLDAASFAFSGALRALFGAMNASEAHTCLTDVDATGGLLSHVLVRSHAAGLARLLFRGARLPPGDAALAQLRADVGLPADGAALWRDVPGFAPGGGARAVGKGALDDALGPQLPLIASALLLAEGAPAALAVAPGGSASTVAAPFSPLDALCGRNHAGWTPLDEAYAHGLGGTVRWLLAALGGRACGAPRSNGLTGPHLAAAGGYARVLRAAAEAGADVGARDAAGRTPCGVARALGPLGRGAAEALRGAGACGEAPAPAVADCPHGAADWPEGERPPLAVRGPALEAGAWSARAHAAAGWAALSPTELAGAGLPRRALGGAGAPGGGDGGASATAPLPRPGDVWCPIDVLPLATAQRGRAGGGRFVADYLDAGRPFLARGGGGGAAFMPEALAALAARTEALPVQVGRTPYAVSYGRGGGSARLGAFLRGAMGGAAALPNASAPRPYVFDGGGAAAGAGDADGAAAALHAALMRDPPALRQLSAGPPLSGAPPHFHLGAVNRLLVGVKLWVLWPPEAAFFFDGDAARWWDAHGGALRRGGRGLAPHYLFLQAAGDYVYIPKHWGHAVVNLADAVGVALE